MKRTQRAPCSTPDWRKHSSNFHGPLSPYVPSKPLHRNDPAPCSLNADEIIPSIRETDESKYKRQIFILSYVNSFRLYHLQSLICLAFTVTECTAVQHRGAKSNSFNYLRPDKYFIKKYFYEKHFECTIGLPSPPANSTAVIHSLISTQCRNAS